MATKLDEELKFMDSLNDLVLFDEYRERMEDDSVTIGRSVGV